ncbi:MULTISPECIES: hypothetical protein [Streptomyces]|uniref:Uncharacterized protein n=2 Tax=Streptomyces rimosus subsp. rimosus TaxID=132474 RepID=L8ET38_STRR1|nr:MULTISPECIES: hypothetical protein [Streptomyces]KOG81552.1 hypothetical protein ADK78_03840 [Kitasatospora aureofaciens]MYT42801.1 hypothetical protein [Streptomyces sp. SID5471]KEF05174.1 hypothetical protein DF17_20080 [Streptomyces rimosus]KEF19408.1 hypothetical protein DF18_18640 [Streptomyces rimosus]KOT30912.1 hypothetical protein ADK84_31145 [Streptomyces sp. NRRL WC-3701]
MDDSLLLLTVAVAALVVGTAGGWAAQAAVVRRRLTREQSFFGLPDGSECVLVTHRDSTSAHWSIPRHDALALLGLASVVENCGAHAEVAPHDTGLQGFGARTEFCVGDPTAHRRLAAHMANLLPGVAVHPGDEHGIGRGTFAVGGSTYRLEPGATEHVLLARLTAVESGRPVFLAAGQRPVTHRAAVRHLVRNRARLARKYGADGQFCLLLKVVNSQAYGPDVVELVADVTKAALAPPEPKGHRASV